MKTMTEFESSTDKRIDDLRPEVHRGFDRVEGEMRQGFGRIDADVRELRSDIGSLQRLMIGFFATTLGTIVSGVVVIVLSHS